MGPEELYGYQTPAPVYEQPDPHKRRRIIIGISGISFFLLALLVVLVMIFSPPNILPQITKISALQNEASRVAQLAIDSTKAHQSTKVMATNTRVISLGNISQIINWVDANLSNSISESGLASQLSENIDTALIDAGQQNEYDTKFNEIIANVLNVTNSEITQNMDSFNPYPQLQTILLEVKNNNSILLDSIN